MMVEDKFLTVSEVAVKLGYTEQHIRLLLRQGKLRGRKIGRDWMVPYEVVELHATQQDTAPLFPVTRRGRPPGSSIETKKRVG
jgi:excisionase family DNA binding protein